MYMSTKPQVCSLKTLLWVSASLRLLLICWGEFQDRTMQVKYTDIDYVVFTDAARFVADSRSPFERSTYRYSPLLAYLLVPNIFLHGAWGKLLFSAGDILAAAMISRLLRRLQTPEPAVVLAAAAWLCNPFTFTISTRGSCDVVAVLLLLALLQLLLSGRTWWAAAVYGLVVHLRIYPIIFAPSLVFFLAKSALVKQQAAAAIKAPPADQQQTTNAPPLQPGRPAQQEAPETTQHRPDAPASLWTHAPSAYSRQILRQGATFGSASAAVFLALGFFFYLLYGQQFLHEAFLHHVTRKDPRHNFSPHFYPLYLGGFGHGTSATHPQTSPSDSLNQALTDMAGEGLVGFSRDDISQLIENTKSSEHPCSPPLCDADLSEVSQGTGGRGAAAAEADFWVPDVAAWASCLQLLLQLVLAAALHCDLPACLLLQTMAFVALNKVCTAQYFVWYFSLVPLILPRLPWPLPRGLTLALAAWIGSQLHWLLWGYLLEFQGLPVHLLLWFASIVFLGANTLLMVQIIRCLNPSSSCRARTFLEASCDKERQKQKTH